MTNRPRKESFAPGDLVFTKKFTPGGPTWLSHTIVKLISPHSFHTQMVALCVNMLIMFVLDMVIRQSPLLPRVKKHNYGSLLSIPVEESDIPLDDPRPLWHSSRH